MKSEQLIKHHEEHQELLLQHRFYQTIMVDVDSTVVGKKRRVFKPRKGIEGIVELAKIHKVEKKVDQLTSCAMEGDLPFDTALDQRLRLINPKESDMKKVSDIYETHIVPDAIEVFRVLRKAGVNISLLSGGFINTMKSLANSLGVPMDQIYANELFFNEDDQFIDFDINNLMSQKGGKGLKIKELLETGKITGQVAMMGDGATDLEGGQESNLMIGFGGFVQRERVIKEADIFLSESTFAPLILLLLDPPKIRKIFYEQPENREILIKAFNSISGVLFNNRAKLLQQSIMELYEEFVFYAKNIKISNS